MNALQKYVVRDVPVDDVFLVGERRAVREEAVDALVESIKRIGLQTPISVRVDDTIPDPDTGEVMGGYALIAGRHRLEACRRLGFARIPVVEIEGDEINAEMWEIAENLHRADLTALERDEQVSRWAELAAREVSDKLSETDRAKGGRPGVAAKAAKELGINERDVRRAVSVAGLSDEAKQAARDAGLDDNRRALLKAAKEPPEKQAGALREYRPQRVDIPAPKDWSDVEDEQKRKLMNAWNGASPTVQMWFRESVVDRPVMDGATR